MKISKNVEGMRYRLEILTKKGEKAVKAEVRVMPGNPNARWSSQRAPYVKHCVDGVFLDNNGAIVLENQAEAHIPLLEYNFIKLSRLLPYD